MSTGKVHPGHRSGGDVEFPPGQLPNIYNALKVIQEENKAAGTPPSASLLKSRCISVKTVSAVSQCPRLTVSRGGWMCRIQGADFCAGRPRDIGTTDQRVGRPSGRDGTH